MRRLVALTLPFALLFVSGSAPAAGPDPSCPTVVTHRANPLVAPENTVAGIKSVQGTGSGTVEVDVQWTKSGFPVLMHDATVDRTTNGIGPVSAMSQPQATQLSAVDYAPWIGDARYSGVKVPYGYEFVKAAVDNDLNLLLHVTGVPTEAGMVKLARYLDVFAYRPRAVLMSSADRVKSMRGWQPTLRYVLIEYNGADTIRRGESIKALGVEGYAVPFRDASPAAVAYWRSFGLTVAVWTSDPGFDTADNWLTVARSGADLLITNQPTAAVGVLTC